MKARALSPVAFVPSCGFSGSSVHFKSELACSIKQNSMPQNFTRTKRIRTIKLSQQSIISGFRFFKKVVVIN